MGHTHYFTKKKNTVREDWNSMVHDLKTVFKNCFLEKSGSKSNIQICDGMGVEKLGSPDSIIVDKCSKKECIVFNGHDDLSHETFIICSNDPLDKFSFCKTNRKPYDWLVVATLILIDNHMPGVYELGSDEYRKDLIKIKEELEVILDKKLTLSEGIGY